MIINDIMEEKNLSIAKLAKKSGLPYMTVHDICSEKVKVKDSTAETVFKIAKALNISTDILLTECVVERPSFENFKSAICHRVKSEGEKAFIIAQLESRDIDKYYQRKWYPEACYTLAMLDYLSRRNNVSRCKEFNYLRQMRFEEPIYPASIIVLANAKHDPGILQIALEKSIPEFAHFNIVENEVFNNA